MNDDLEILRTEVPGAATRELTPPLRAFESRNVTFVDDEIPVFWQSASGATVTDVDGNRYIDLTAAFGVANAGHSNSRVAAAIADQAARLMHAMGDVHPTAVKVELLRKLAAIAPGDLSKTFLASTGSEAVEAALKTAIVATGKPAFAAFRGAYHGLSLGALAVSGIAKFREPFVSAVAQTTLFFDYGEPVDALRERLRTRADVGALIVEPLQGRGGCVVPPKGYLADLRALCNELNLLLIFDEIYTGFGRTGYTFACMHDEVVPDILCLGKAMANGFPISATIAKPAIMDAWPVSRGEALHTSTYLGNPMGCAAALATIGEMERLHLPARAREIGIALGARLQRIREAGKAQTITGRGLMWGIGLRDGAHAERVVKAVLRKGVVLLQAGLEGNVLSITPPLVIGEQQLFHAIDIIEEAL
ncbi:MAG TPA: aspartate aminotransferase family protein [Candidatus Baltobacteraceae bacterium]